MSIDFYWTFYTKLRIKRQPQITIIFFKIKILAINTFYESINIWQVHLPFTSFFASAAVVCPPLYWTRFGSLWGGRRLWPFVWHQWVAAWC
jgi:hypothetical protein